MNLKRSMAIGSAWMIAGRWTLRSIGFVSTMVLARVLTPTDFGLVAIAMVVIGAIEVLGDTAQHHALVRMQDPTKEHFNTAWTMGVIAGLICGALIMISAPITAQFSDDPRLTIIMLILSLKPIVQGFENVGLVNYQRQLDFRTDIKIMLTGKLAGFFITITLALVFRSYWALIFGTLSYTAASVAASYLFCPYRPRFALSTVPALWSFSIWTLAQTVFDYLADRVDRIVLSSTNDAHEIGKYSVAAEVAAMPTEELVVPPFRALFGVYAKSAHDTAALRDLYMTALSYLAIIAPATGVGVALVAHDMVAVILGPQWIDAARLVPWMALAAAIFGVSRSAITVLMALGYARINAARSFIALLLLIPALVVGQSIGNLEGAAIARLCITVLLVPLLFLPVLRALQIGVGALLQIIWRPVLASILMALAVTAARPLLPDIAVIRLPISIAIGGATFSLCLLLAWALAGQPRGAETTFVAIGARWLRTLRGAD